MRRLAEEGAVLRAKITVGLPRTVVAATLALFLAACQGATPSAPTGDVFTAAPWQHGERLLYDLRSVDGELVAHAILETRVEDGGRVVLQQHYTEAQPPQGAPPATDQASVTVDAATFRPIKGNRVLLNRDATGTPTQERYLWSYGRDPQGRVEMTSTRMQGGEEDGRSLRPRDHYYDNESSLWLWRSLAFEEGFNRNYVSVNPVERSQQTVNLQIPQQETVTVPAGTFEAWRLIFRSGRAVRTAWVNVEAPHEIVRWDNGDLIYELTSVQSAARP